MGRSKYIEPKALRVIDVIMDMQGEITLEEAVEIMRPHITLDLMELKEHKIKDIARRHLGKRKDSTGVRKCFAAKQEGQSVYIDLDTCNSLTKVEIVNDQLSKKLYGLARSQAKANRKQQELEGQMVMKRLSQNQG